MRSDSRTGIVSTSNIVGCLIVWGMLAASAVGQGQVNRIGVDELIVPGTCNAVNLARDTAMVIDATGELQLLGGAVVPFSEVDSSGIVSINGLPAGLIELAEDGEGLLKLWWRWFDSSVVDFNPATGQFGPTSRLPSSFVGVPCGVCEVIDDVELCGCGDTPGCCIENADCDDANECTADLCESSTCVHENRDAVCDDFDACTGDDLCVNGVCSGVAIQNCEIQPGDPNAGDPTADAPEADDPILGGVGALPRLTFSLCGTGATLAMCLTAVGLVTARTTRRHHR